ncbi:hypothetical protein NOVO_03245 [Rickettsiales bacterium Ac37b]|nr:hypothetical protein NOVO_03245 [Rickettsiales bacterium Ac37b]
MPTIGVGFTLINKVKNKWEAYDIDYLKSRGMNLSHEQYNIIVDYAKSKSNYRDTSHLKQ